MTATPAAASPTILFDRKTFFALVKKPLFGGKLTSEQITGMELTLATWEGRSPAGDIRHLAYILATRHRETGRRMVPVEERGGAAYFKKMYDPKGSRPQVAKELGNTQPGDGVLFHGRGGVQATGRANYAKLAKLTGKPLVEHPEMMLDPDVDVVATFVAMETGLYTGRKLSDYFNATTDDPKNARRIINKLDHADEIAANDAAFLRVLVAARAAAKAAAMPQAA